MTAKNYRCNIFTILSLMALTGSLLLLIFSAMALREHQKIQKFKHGTVVYSEDSSYEIVKNTYGYVGKMYMTGYFRKNENEIFNVTAITHTPPYIVNSKTKKQVQKLINTHINTQKYDVLIDPITDSQNRHTAYTKNVDRHVWITGAFFGAVLTILFLVLVVTLFLLPCGLYFDGWIYPFWKLIFKNQVNVENSV